ncbi:MAG: cytochrome c oxidase subunit 3 [Candidatus Latescibacteria bacterium]|nr:cytochrome c oxidase subunit 3 [Candidatus Latescibacterota bacterium]
MSAEIPYIVKPHPVTGIYNAKFGTWLFLASEVMLFGALFSSYVLLRVGAEAWPLGSKELNVPLATLNTLVLIASSMTMVMSWASLKMQRFGRYRLYLGGTVLLALVFLAIKFYEYGEKFEHQIFPSTSTFYAIYFTLTGLHGLHVLGGVLVILYLLFPGSAMWSTEPERLTNRVECAGLYWHFVDLVWIFLFPTLYLL